MTGVSRWQGIGFAIARRLAAHGASVFLHHHRPHDLEQPWGGDDLDAVRAGVAHDGRPGGRIVFLTSGQQQGPMPGEVAHAAATGALAETTLTISDQLADTGIATNTINPGPVDTGHLDEATWRSMRSTFGAGPLRRTGRPGRPDGLAGHRRGPLDHRPGPPRSTGLPRGTDLGLRMVQRLTGPERARGPLSRDGPLHRVPSSCVVLRRDPEPGVLPQQRSRHRDGLLDTRTPLARIEVVRAQFHVGTPVQAIAPGFHGVAARSSAVGLSFPPPPR